MEVNFSRKKNLTGFHRCLQYGNYGDYVLVFYVKLYDGNYHEVVQYRGNRSDIVKVLKKFRLARKFVGKNSDSINSSNYNIGSLRWIGCHNGKIRILYDKIKTIYFKNPCLRKILKSVEN